MKLPDQVLEGIRKFIIDSVNEHPKNLVEYVSKELSYSKSAVRRMINQLIDEELIERDGVGRGTSYLLKVTTALFKYVLKDGLNEDVIWSEDLKPLFMDAKPNVLQICQYGCTEMINNVIDHSSAKIFSIHVTMDLKSIMIGIVDFGIGIFRKIQEDMGLEYINQSLLELAKGKFTSDPKNHTGEGVFFTSKACNQFTIISGGLRYLSLEDRGLLDDFEGTDFKGTGVGMMIAQDSERTLESVFDAFSSPDSDPSFHKTFIPLHLMQYEGESLLSRSQAKRAMARVEQFTEVVLDFSEVDLVGPAFVDQIFRVFHNENPHVHLYVQNANEKVVRRVKSVDSDAVIFE